jgi:hypothetical protein
MTDDKEIAKHTLDMQARGKDYSLPQITGFKEWAEKKSSDGGSEDAIDSMFSLSMYLLPEEALALTDEDFDEMYDEILDDIN